DRGYEILKERSQPVKCKDAISF
ncbi:hypothetical protein, partial [Acinetobacter sp. 228]